MALGLKQWVADDPGFIEPILVDYVKQIYFVQSTGTWELGLRLAIPQRNLVNPFDVYENGGKNSSCNQLICL